MDLSKVKLSYRDVAGSGKQISATLNQEFECVEFRIRGDAPVTVMKSLTEPVVISFEPFIQFSPKAWDDTLDTIFKEVVRLWEKEHGKV